VTKRERKHRVQKAKRDKGNNNKWKMGGKERGHEKKTERNGR